MKDCIICQEHNLSPCYPLQPSVAYHGAHVWLVCSKCWTYHITTQLNSGQPTSEIPCVSCDHSLLESEIKALTLNSVLDLYLTKQLEEALRTLPDFRTCPAADCSFGYILTSDDEQSDGIFNCRLCKSLYCIRCEEPMLKGISCRAYQESKKVKLEQDEKEQQTLDYFKDKDNTKQCPTCNRWIEKNGGCDHMTCVQCAHEFCWACFAPYAGEEGIRMAGNGAHDTSCRYHPDRLPSAYESDSDDGEDAWPYREDYDGYENDW